MSTLTRTSTTALAVVALALGAAGCGGDDAGSSNVSASGTSASGQTGHDMSSMASGSAPSQAQQEASASTMQMQRMGAATAGDEKVELDASDPVTFSVYEGDRLVKHAPREGENAHLMLTLSDAQSGDRLPDATITLRVTDEAGKVVSSGPQYPMIGMGMGIHYGDNVTLPKSGKYVAQLVIGPPRIGRHSDVTDRWNTTTKASIPFTWKGAAR
ncbi:iron transporter [Patulibacter sp. NPDC049589]|uniref:iron transporter n=1 Tax=Patulibacter sp. NPDC049589 TaxID=3154731 RepID=UPI00342D9238